MGNSVAQGCPTSKWLGDLMRQRPHQQGRHAPGAMGLQGCMPCTLALQTLLYHLQAGGCIPRYEGHSTSSLTPQPWAPPLHSATFAPLAPCITVGYTALPHSTLLHPPPSGRGMKTNFEKGWRATCCYCSQSVKVAKWELVGNILTPCELYVGQPCIRLMHKIQEFGFSCCLRSGT